MPVGMIYEEDKHLLGRRWVRGERRDFLTGGELGMDGWRQDTVGEGGERRDCLGIQGTSCRFCLMRLHGLVHPPVQREVDLSSSSTSELKYA